MSNRLVLLLAAVMLAGGCGPQAAAPAPKAGSSAQVEETQADTMTEAPIIVMLGDSLTAGFQLPPGSALPAVIQRRLDAAGVRATLVNAGVSGDMTSDGLARYDWSVSGSNADLLVVALGANDFLNGLPPETAKANLAAILDRAKADGLPVALVGVAAPREGAASPRDAAYAKIYADLAATYGLPLYPDMLNSVAGKPELLLDDGVHPTADGVEAMATGIAGFLSPLIPVER